MEIKPMNEALQKAINELAEKAGKADPHEAVQLAQAALNLAHVASIVSNLSK